MRRVNQELMSWVVLVIIIFIQTWNSCDGCLDSERIALLQIKSAINYPNATSLSSWGLNVNCLSWDWIEWDPSTGRVIELRLSSTKDWNLGDWYLNVSLFLPFQQLKTLDLSYNQIVGCIKNEGFEKLSKLENLEDLNLSGNKLSNNIISSLSALSSLKSLYLNENRLKGTLNIEDLNNLTSLEELHMTFNEIEGFKSLHGFEKLSKLDNLEVLDLRYNNLSNNIISSLSALSSLKSLYLDDNRLNGTLNIEDLNNLTSLKELSIADNEIEGFKSLKGSEEVLKLSNLESLYLSYNNFNNSILPSLSGLSSLKYLYIDGNQLKGVINLKELEASSKLEELSLDGNQIEKIIGSRDMKGQIKLILNGMVVEGKNYLLESLGVLPNLKSLDLSWSELKGTVIGEGSYNLSNMEELYLDQSSLDAKSLQSLGQISSLKLLSLTYSNGLLPSGGWPNFKNLEHLYLSYSTIESEFLQTVGMITSLKTLSLPHCQLNGTIPAYQGLCQLKHLQELDLRDNNFSGSLPLYLANLTFLQRLDLSYNHFIGDISLSSLTSLTSLQYLDLSNNLFQIPISLFTFFNHSKLTFLDGGGNKVYADTEEYHTLIPKFQLDSLSLNGDGNVGGFPKFLYYQQNLKSIDLSNLKMEGQFPYWLLENNTKLESLYLANNSLSGSLQLPIHPHLNLTVLDISENFFNSYIPMEIGTHFPSLVYISMSQNNLSGSIPSSFGNMSFLNFLDLSKNEIFGSLPSKFIHPQLTEVHLSENKLQGPLENVLCDGSSLIALDLRHNNFSGSIPIWISTLSQLSYLSLGHNNFEGQIPYELCKLKKLSLIDLSNNNISGHIVPCLQVNNYGHEAFLRQSLEFATKYSIYDYTPMILQYLSGIDLSNNKLSGEIPIQFGSLSIIKVLNLSHNCLTGHIPSTFSYLSAVESLDLSYNNLDGQIPPQLTLLYSLEVFNIAHNNLSGKTPERVAQFATFEKESYEGNPLLCGLPLPNSCNTTSPTLVPITSMDENEDDGFIDMGVFYVSFAVTYIIVLLGIATILYINPYWRQTWFYFIEVNMTRSYFFLVDNIPFLSKFKLS